VERKGPLLGLSIIRAKTAPNDDAKEKTKRTERQKKKATPKSKIEGGENGSSKRATGAASEKGEIRRNRPSRRRGDGNPSPLRNPRTLEYSKRKRQCFERRDVGKREKKY